MNKQMNEGKWFFISCQNIPFHYIYMNTITILLSSSLEKDIWKESWEKEFYQKYFFPSDIEYTYWLHIFCNSRRSF